MSNSNFVGNVDIRKTAVPIPSVLRNAPVDFGRMTAGVVALAVNFQRRGQSAVGFTCHTNDQPAPGNHFPGCGGAGRQRLHQNYILGNLANGLSSATSSLSRCGCGGAGRYTRREEYAE